MIITLDGPVASGKSTIGRLVADKLSFYFVYSGFFYRALAFVHYGKNISIDDLVNLDRQDLSYFYNKDIGYKIFFKQEDISPFLKTAQVDSWSSIISTEPRVRVWVHEYIRFLSKDKDIVADGRDCGTVVFPDADFKFFITARPEVRAKRWRLDQEKFGLSLDFDRCLMYINQRDERDSSRKISPLKLAENGILIDTSDLSIDEVLNIMLKKIAK